MKFYSCFPTRTSLLITGVVLILLSLPVNGQEIVATGSGTNLQQATENAHISAHFKCNRKRLWADLDKLKITGTDRSSYTIAGGKKKINQYYVKVKTSCTTKYQRYPSDQQPSD